MCFSYLLFSVHKWFQFAVIKQQDPTDACSNIKKTYKNMPELLINSKFTQLKELKMETYETIDQY